SRLGAMNSGPVFHELVSALNTVQIPYMVVGSFASNLYGAGRGTLDIDIVISATPDQIRAFLEALPPADYYYDLPSALEAWKHRSMFNILDMKRGWKVDLIFAKQNPYHLAAFQRRTSAKIDGVSLIAATAEDVIVSKLEWAQMGGSSRQIEDVAGILKERRELLDLNYVEKWVKDLGVEEQWAAARSSAGTS
ncbi:MAG TPA: hypothetical protein VFY05_00155, partial [Candidatus Angelobacter sp.]|nr:hypothetical protein [Candidatus Angelobacter sp.]